MGKKDIIKIEGGLDLVDLDVLGFVDNNITVNIIKNGEIVEKKRLSLPKQVTNIIKCKNQIGRASCRERVSSSV